MRLRRYQPTDQQAVDDLHRLGLDQTGTNVPGLADADLDDIPSTYLENRGEFLVAEIDMLIVGMGALLRRSEAEAEIKRMRVHPEHQRKGIGRALLETLERRAVELGYTRLILDTAAIQTSAVALYVSAGYTEIARPTIHGFECILYEKRL